MTIKPKRLGALLAAAGTKADDEGDMSSPSAHGVSSDEGEGDEDEERDAADAEAMALAEAALALEDGDESHLSLRERRKQLHHQQRLDERTRDLALLLWSRRKLPRFWRSIAQRKELNAQFDLRLARKRAAILAGRSTAEAHQRKRQRRAARSWGPRAHLG